MTSTKDAVEVKALSEEDVFEISAVYISRVDAFELWTDKPVVEGSPSVGSHTLFRLPFLVDTGATGFAFIDEKLVPIICSMFNITPYRLPRPKQLKGYDGVLSRKPITHAIYPTLTVAGHTAGLQVMFITKLGQHAAILGKPYL